MSGPLFDTLFRPTTPPRPGRSASPTTPREPGAAGRGNPSGNSSSAPTDIASAAPVRAAGSHSRAGNAMGRTRAALLRGAAHAVEATGTKITMAQVAALSGVAKATLYNHFRTRDAVLDALLLDQVDAIVDAQSDKPLRVALADAAQAVADSPVRRGLARAEPASLAALGRIDTSAPAWQAAHAAVAAALDTAGLAGTDTVLRWLASFVVTPAAPSVIRADVEVLLAGLPRGAASAITGNASARTA